MSKIVKSLGNDEQGHPMIPLDATDRIQITFWILLVVLVAAALWAQFTIAQVAVGGVVMLLALFLFEHFGSTLEKWASQLSVYRRIRRLR